MQVQSGEGNLVDGNGTMQVGSGAFDVPFSFSTRFEEEPGTNPEELIGAAFIGCYTMALSHTLDGAGFTPTRVTGNAKVHFGKDEAAGGFKSPP